jgi:hypothetical protein
MILNDAISCLFHSIRALAGRGVSTLPSCLAQKCRHSPYVILISSTARRRIDCLGTGVQDATVLRVDGGGKHPAETDWPYRDACWELWGHAALTPPTGAILSHITAQHAGAGVDGLCGAAGVCFFIAKNGTG